MGVRRSRKRAGIPSRNATGFPLFSLKGIHGSEESVFLLRFYGTGLGGFLERRSKDHCSTPLG